MRLDTTLKTSSFIRKSSCPSNSFCLLKFLTFSSAVFCWFKFLTFSTKVRNFFHSRSFLLDSFGAVVAHSKSNGTSGCGWLRSALVYVAYPTELKDVPSFTLREDCECCMPCRLNLNTRGTLPMPVTDILPHSWRSRHLPFDQSRCQTDLLRRRGDSPLWTRR